MQSDTVVDAATPPALAALDRRVLHEAVAARLRELIVEGVLVPGAHLNERVLCERLAVSRTPLREAFRTLSGEGIVELLPNRGAVVAALSREDVEHAFELMAALESLAGDLAARRATPIERDELVPEARIDYHGVFVRVRCAVITGRTVAAGGGALGRAVYEPARHRFRVELADMLLAAVGADPALADPGAPDAEVDARAWFADPPAPIGESPADRLAAREAAVLEAHVRARTDVGEGLADADRRDRIAVLGEPGEGGSRWVAAAEEAGRAGDASVIGQLARSARRDAVLWPDPPRR